MELMSKAEKAMRNSGPNRRDSGRRCYGCGDYGHFQATCPFRKLYEWSPASRRPSPSFRRGARGGHIGSCKVLQGRNKELIRPRELIITYSLRNWQLHILEPVKTGLI